MTTSIETTDDSEAARPASMSERDKALRDRLRRAEGQLHGVIGMLEHGRECEDIVTQLLAVRTAVDRVASELILSYMDQCLTRLPPEEARQVVSRALKLLTK